MSYRRTPPPTVTPIINGGGATEQSGKGFIALGGPDGVGGPSFSSFRRGSTAAQAQQPAILIPYEAPDSPESPRHRKGAAGGGGGGPLGGRRRSTVTISENQPEEVNTALRALAPHAVADRDDGEEAGVAETHEEKGHHHDHHANAADLEGHTAAATERGHTTFGATANSSPSAPLVKVMPWWQRIVLDEQFRHDVTIMNTRLVRSLEEGVMMDEGGRDGATAADGSSGGDDVSSLLSRRKVKPSLVSRLFPREVTMERPIPMHCAPDTVVAEAYRAYQDAQDELNAMRRRRAAAQQHNTSNAAAAKAGGIGISSIARPAAPPTAPSNSCSSMTGARRAKLQSAASPGKKKALGAGRVVPAPPSSPAAAVAPHSYEKRGIVITLPSVGNPLLAHPSTVRETVVGRGGGGGGADGDDEAILLAMRMGSGGGGGSLTTNALSGSRQQQQQVLTTQIARFGHAMLWRPHALPTYHVPLSANNTATVAANGKVALTDHLREALSLYQNRKKRREANAHKRTNRFFKKVVTDQCLLHGRRVPENSDEEADGDFGVSRSGYGLMVFDDARRMLTVSESLFSPSMATSVMVKSMEQQRGGGGSSPSPERGGGGGGGGRSPFTGTATTGDDIFIANFNSSPLRANRDERRRSSLGALGQSPASANRDEGAGGGEEGEQSALVAGEAFGSSAANAFAKLKMKREQRKAADKLRRQAARGDAGSDVGSSSSSGSDSQESEGDDASSASAPTEGEEEGQQSLNATTRSSNKQRRRRSTNHNHNHHRNLFRGGAVGGDDNLLDTYASPLPVAEVFPPSGFIVEESTRTEVYMPPYSSNGVIMSASGGSVGHGAADDSSDAASMTLTVANTIHNNSPYAVKDNPPMPNLATAAHCFCGASAEGDWHYALAVGEQRTCLYRAMFEYLKRRHDSLLNGGGGGGSDDHQHGASLAFVASSPSAVSTMIRVKPSAFSNFALSQAVQTIAMAAGEGSSATDASAPPPPSAVGGLIGIPQDILNRRREETEAAVKLTFHEHNKSILDYSRPPRGAGGGMGNRAVTSSSATRTTTSNSPILGGRFDFSQRVWEQPIAIVTIRKTPREVMREEIRLSGDVEDAIGEEEALNCAISARIGSSGGGGGAPPSSSGGALSLSEEAARYAALDTPFTVAYVQVPLPRRYLGVVRPSMRLVRWHVLTEAIHRCYQEEKWRCLGGTAAGGGGGGGAASAEEAASAPLPHPNAPLGGLSGSDRLSYYEQFMHKMPSIEALLTEEENDERRQRSKALRQQGAAGVGGGEKSRPASSSSPRFAAGRLGVGASHSSFAITKPSTLPSNHQTKNTLTTAFTTNAHNRRRYMAALRRRNRRIPKRLDSRLLPPTACGMPSVCFLGLDRKDLTVPRHDALYRSQQCRSALREIFETLEKDPRDGHIMKKSFVVFVLDLLHLFMPCIRREVNILTAEDEWAVFNKSWESGGGGSANSNNNKPSAGGGGGGGGSSTASSAAMAVSLSPRSAYDVKPLTAMERALKLKEEEATSSATPTSSALSAPHNSNKSSNTVGGLLAGDNNGTNPFSSVAHPNAPAYLQTEVNPVDGSRKHKVKYRDEERDRKRAIENLAQWMASRSDSDRRQQGSQQDHESLFHCGNMSVMGHTVMYLPPSVGIGGSGGGRTSSSHSAMSAIEEANRSGGAGDFQQFYNFFFSFPLMLCQGEVVTEKLYISVWRFVRDCLGMGYGYNSAGNTNTNASAATSAAAVTPSATMSAAAAGAREKRSSLQAPATVVAEAHPTQQQHQHLLESTTNSVAVAPTPHHPVGAGAEAALPTSAHTALPPSSSAITRNSDRYHEYVINKALYHTMAASLGAGGGGMGGGGGATMGRRALMVKRIADALHRKQILAAEREELMAMRQQKEAEDAEAHQRRDGGSVSNATAAGSSSVLFVSTKRPSVLEEIMRDNYDNDEAYRRANEEEGMYDDSDEDEDEGGGGHSSDDDGRRSASKPLRAPSARGSGGGGYYQKAYIDFGALHRAVLVNEKERHEQRQQQRQGDRPAAQGGTAAAAAGAPAPSSSMLTATMSTADAVKAAQRRLAKVIPRLSSKYGSPFFPADNTAQQPSTRGTSPTPAASSLLAQTSYSAYSTFGTAALRHKVLLEEEVRRAEEALATAERDSHDDDVDEDGRRGRANDDGGGGTAAVYKTQTEQFLERLSATAHHRKVLIRRARAARNNLEAAKLLLALDSTSVYHHPNMPRDAVDDLLDYCSDLSDDDDDDGAVVADDDGPTNNNNPPPSFDLAAVGRRRRRSSVGAGILLKGTTTTDPAMNSSNKGVATAEDPLVPIHDDASAPPSSSVNNTKGSNPAKQLDTFANLEEALHGMVRTAYEARVKHQQAIARQQQQQQQKGEGTVEKEGCLVPSSAADPNPTSTAPRGPDAPSDAPSAPPYAATTLSIAATMQQMGEALAKVGPVMGRGSGRGTDDDVLSFVHRIDCEGGGYNPKEKWRNAVAAGRTPSSASASLRRRGNNTAHRGGEEAPPSEQLISEGAQRQLEEDVTIEAPPTIVPTMGKDELEPHQQRQQQQQPKPHPPTAPSSTFVVAPRELPADRQLQVREEARVRVLSARPPIRPSSSSSSHVKDSMRTPMDMGHRHAVAAVGGHIPYDLFKPLASSAQTPSAVMNKDKNTADSSSNGVPPRRVAGQQQQQSPFERDAAWASSKASDAGGERRPATAQPMGTAVSGGASKKVPLRKGNAAWFSMSTRTSSSYSPRTATNSVTGTAAQRPALDDSRTAATPTRALALGACAGAGGGADIPTLRPEESASLMMDASGLANTTNSTANSTGNALRITSPRVGGAPYHHGNTILSSTPTDTAVGAVDRVNNGIGGGKPPLALSATADKTVIASPSFATTPRRSSSSFLLESSRKGGPPPRNIHTPSGTTLLPRSDGPTPTRTAAAAFPSHASLAAFKNDLALRRTIDIGTLHGVVEVSAPGGADSGDIGQQQRPPSAIAPSMLNDSRLETMTPIVVVPSSTHRISATSNNLTSSVDGEGANALTVRRTGSPRVMLKGTVLTPSMQTNRVGRHVGGGGVVRGGVSADSDATNAQQQQQQLHEFVTPSIADADSGLAKVRAAAASLATTATYNRAYAVLKERELAAVGDGTFANSTPFINPHASALGARDPAATSAESLGMLHRSSTAEAAAGAGTVVMGSPSRMIYMRNRYDEVEREQQQEALQHQSSSVGDAMSALARQFGGGVGEGTRPSVVFNAKQLRILGRMEGGQPAVPTLPSSHTSDKSAYLLSPQSVALMKASGVVIPPHPAGIAPQQHASSASLRIARVDVGEINDRHLALATEATALLESHTLLQESWLVGTPSVVNASSRLELEGGTRTWTNEHATGAGKDVISNFGRLTASIDNNNSTTAAADVGADGDDVDVDVEEHAATFGPFAQSLYSGTFSSTAGRQHSGNAHGATNYLYSTHYSRPPPMMLMDGVPAPPDPSGGKFSGTTPTFVAVGGNSTMTASNSNTRSSSPHSPSAAHSSSAVDPSSSSAAYSYSSEALVAYYMGHPLYRQDAETMVQLERLRLLIAKQHTLEANRGPPPGPLSGPSFLHAGVNDALYDEARRQGPSVEPSIVVQYGQRQQGWFHGRRGGGEGGLTVGGEKPAANNTASPEEAPQHYSIEAIGNMGKAPTAQSGVTISSSTPLSARPATNSSSSSRAIRQAPRGNVGGAVPARRGVGSAAAPIQAMMVQGGSAVGPTTRLVPSPPPPTPQQQQQKARSLPLQ